MATLGDVDYTIHLAAPGDGCELEQDEEWCEVECDGQRRRIRFHDYTAIFAVPGLYERLFAEHLGCDSPRVVTELLGAELLATQITKGQRLAALDLGAGNGMVGELLVELVTGDIVGVDVLPEARAAAHRDRPGVYDDYYALDLTQLRPSERRDLMRHDFGVMTCVGALGYGDIPPPAFAAAVNLVGSPGWVAFNIRDQFLDARHPSGFGQLIARLFREGVFDERARKRYTHRFSVTGEPLEYVAVVAEKRDDIPPEWARDIAGLSWLRGS